MTNKEAIAYLITPIATSTEPSAEYLKQKEAYDLAIKTLEERQQGEWRVYEGVITCEKCGTEAEEISPFCAWCGADMQKGGKE